jgi:hypothetical protein
MGPRPGLWESLRFLYSEAADDDQWRTRTSHVHRERGDRCGAGQFERERALDIMDALLGELDFT